MRPRGAGGGAHDGGVEAYDLLADVDGEQLRQVYGGSAQTPNDDPPVEAAAADPFLASMAVRFLLQRMRGQSWRDRGMEEGGRRAKERN
eukprot:298228-Hanusia_phi.AAC.8